jgi:hypothetical protein
MEVALIDEPEASCHLGDLVSARQPSLRFFEA